MGKEQEEAYSRREFLKRYGTRIGAAVLLSGAGSLAAPLIENGILGNELYPSSENLNPNPYPSPYGSIILPPIRLNPLTYRHQRRTKHPNPLLRKL